MKKAVYNGVRDIRIEDVPMPEVPDDGLLVKVKFCGICGSDLHEYDHGPSTGIFAPGVWGHEFSGDVAEVGRAVDAYEPGDRVVGTFVMGAYAEYVVGPAKWFHKMDDRMSYEDGAVTEPTTVACYAVSKGAVQPGESALVVGAGPIGLLTVMALKAAGAGPIYASDTIAKRRALARDVGADEVFDPSACDVVAEVRERTRGGRGVDVSFECVGLRPAIIDSINAVRRHKRVVVEGMFSGDVTLDFNEIWQKDISLLFSLGADFDATMPLIAEGKIPSARIITSKIGMDEIITRGIERLTGDATEEVKILVSPEG
jgi:(R,R)-butanediol dehydrogenase/meso-butanediol dehydrogenase/diacetyl reductase